jgi:hypothetical protein
LQAVISHIQVGDGRCELVAGFFARTSDSASDLAQSLELLVYTPPSVGRFGIQSCDLLD